MRRSNIILWTSTVLFLSGTAFAQSDEYIQLMNRGAELERAGNYTEALACLQDAIRIAEHQLDPRTLGNTLNSAGLIYDELGRLGDAVRQYRRSLTILERLDAKDTVDYAVVLSNLGADTLELGDRQAAEKMLRESIAIYTNKVAADDRRRAITRTALAQALMDGGHLREAESILQESIAFLRNHPLWGNNLAISINNLGVVRRYQKRTNEAVELFRETIAMTEASFGLNHPRLLQPLNNLGLAYVDAGRLKDADAVMRRALDIAEMRLKPEHPSFGNLMMNYAYLLRKSGRKVEGKQLETRARTVMREAARSNGAGMTVDVAAFRR